MLGIGWAEILIIAVVALIVVGPKDLPVMLRNVGRAAGAMRRMSNEFRRELNKIAATDEIREIGRSVSDPLKKTREEINREFNQIKNGKVEPSGVLKPKEGQDNVFDTLVEKAGKKPAAPLAPAGETSEAVARPATHTVEVTPDLTITRPANPRPANPRSANPRSATSEADGTAASSATGKAEIDSQPVAEVKKPRKTGASGKTAKTQAAKTQTAKTQTGKATAAKSATAKTKTAATRKSTATRSTATTSTATEPAAAKTASKAGNKASKTAQATGTSESAEPQDAKLQNLDPAASGSSGGAGTGSTAKTARTGRSTKATSGTKSKPAPRKRAVKQPDPETTAAEGRDNAESVSETTHETSAVEPGRPNPRNSLNPPLASEPPTVRETADTGEVQ